MVDFDALQAAGIADARDRAALIEYLAGLGFSAEEMVDAERRGRLFGLAGDAIQLTGPPVHSLTTAAQALGLAVPDVARAWAALGLTVAGPEEIALSQADVDGLATWADMRAVLGDEAATALLRVLGSGMARLSEAACAVRTLARTEISIPTNPAAPESTAPIRKPIAA